MTLGEFQTWALNLGSVAKYNDGQFKGECVSLINQYCYRVLGVPAGAWGNAADWGSPYNANVQEYFTQVSSIQPGDILVYTKLAPPYGHIEIALGNGQALGQNRSLDGRVRLSNVLSGYNVILRPKTATGGTTAVDTIKSMYWRLLGREADQGGINTYTKAAGERGWEFVYNDLKNSAEGQADWERRNPTRVAALEQQLADVKKALVDAQNKPPVEVIKVVEKIVEKPVGGIDEQTKATITETNAIVKGIKDILGKVFRF